MAEDTKVTVPPVVPATQPATVPAVKSQAEIDAENAAAKIKAEEAAAEKYKADRAAAELGQLQSQIVYNNAANYACYAITAGAILIGTAYIIKAVKS